MLDTKIICEIFDESDLPSLDEFLTHSIELNGKENQENGNNEELKLSTVNSNLN